MKPYLYAEKIYFKVKERSEPIIAETTLAKILAGYLKPTNGKVFLDQVRIDKIPKGQKASTLVTLTQKAEERLFTELTLEENIILWESRFPSNE